MDRSQLSKTKKDRLVLLARKSNIRGANIMSKERLVDLLVRISAKKTKTKKASGSKTTAQKVISRIKTLPQQRLRNRVSSRQPAAAKAAAQGVMEAPGHQHVEEAKYYVGPAPERHTAQEFNFPYGYGDNRIVIMVRDPWWIYSYWEITQEREEQVKREIRKRGLNPGRSILRVYDVTDIDFNGSNAHSSFDITLEGLARTWYINVGTPNRSWIVDIGILAGNDEFFILARSNCVKTPRFGMSDVIDEEWMCLDEDYWKMFGLSGGFGLGKGSIALKKMFKKRLMQQITSGGVSSLASPVKKKAAKKGFWLVVDMELIVYGQTMPDANVTAQGKNIRLRKDGTFTLRFALPDGKQEIPVVATSRDGDDTKSITPVVTRHTT